MSEEKNPEHEDHDLNSLAKNEKEQTHAEDGPKQKEDNHLLSAEMSDAQTVSELPQKSSTKTPEAGEDEAGESDANSEEVKDSELVHESIEVIADLKGKNIEQAEQDAEETDLGDASLDEAAALNAKAENAVKEQKEDEENNEPLAQETAFVEAASLDTEKSDEPEQKDEPNPQTTEAAPVKEARKPKKDYSALDKEALIDELKRLLKSGNVQDFKEDVYEIRDVFNSKFDEEQKQAQEKFIEEGGNIIDFRYYSPLKKEFNSLYFDYREKRNKYYQNLKKDLNANLETRNQIIEDLKNLKDEFSVENNTGAIYEKFKDIKERWRNAGNIPRDRYNLVWNTYYHHVDNFYDFLHLNREFRDLDYQHNLEQKLKLIEQAEELTKEQNVMRAFRELQMLHHMWKEEIGPVAREYSDAIWDRFSAATKSIHENRQVYFENQDAIHQENLEKKRVVIAKIAAIGADVPSKHSGWQNKLKEVNALRDEFFALGKVPKKNNEETWKAFKNATRDFNRAKNAYYKSIKQEQYDNLEKKKELIKIAEDNKDSDDVETTTELMKKIQAEWKKIGHVPRKDSDKVWKKFKAACNHFFDRLHAAKDEVLKEEKENLGDKQELLDKVKALKMSGDRKEDLDAIKAIIKEWKDTGRVPHSQKNIEQDFNKVLDGLFKQLDMGRKESELIKYDNRVAAIADQEDDYQLNRERSFISKKIDEVTAEIVQLENNLGFFQHVPDDNPMVAEVHKNIAKLKKNKEIWEAKRRKLKSLS
ncbi:MAG: DUF349 domain-containing protein [Leeuwenhoekiella sp.]